VLIDAAGTLRAEALLMVLFALMVKNLIFSVEGEFNGECFPVGGIGSGMASADAPLGVIAVPLFIRKSRLGLLAVLLVLHFLISVF
jgi:hypothetical protein